MSSTSASITRKSGSNFAPSFLLLPKPKRHAMSVLYALCRQVDDVADEEKNPVPERRAALAQWRSEIQRACHGEAATFPVVQELEPVIAQYHLPFHLFDELIKGVEMDLDITRYETFASLEEYCYRVASVVGLLSIEIFGYQDAACKDYAIYLGKALQLTNILRDVRTDAARGRIYIPRSELARFNVTEKEILASEYSPRFAEMAASAASVAKKFYALARQTLPAVDRRSMAAAETMGSVYWKLLNELERRQFNVFGPRPPRLNKTQKMFMVLRTQFRLAAGATAPNYGTA